MPPFHLMSLAALALHPISDSCSGQELLRGLSVQKFPPEPERKSFEVSNFILREINFNSAFYSVILTLI